MSENKESFPAGFILFLIFMVLKLTHVIAWSWWWVTCPLWGLFAIIIAGLLMALLVLCIRYLIRHIHNPTPKEPKP